MLMSPVIRCLTIGESASMTDFVFVCLIPHLFYNLPTKANDTQLLQHNLIDLRIILLLTSFYLHNVTSYDGLQGVSTSM